MTVYFQWPYIFAHIFNDRIVFAGILQIEIIPVPVRSATQFYAFVNGRHHPKQLLPSRAS